MRSRRIRSRFSRPLPKPELIIEASTPAPAREVFLGNVEPSRAREREAYVPTPEDDETVKRVVEELLTSAEVEFEARYEHAAFQRVFVSVEDREAGLLIGRRGSGLEALETLVGRMVSHQVGHAVPVQVDVNEYRARHEKDLREEANELAQKVLRTGSDEHLAPMSARDRRVVHLAIEGMDGLQTFSIGYGGDKHIVIRRVDNNA